MGKPIPGEAVDDYMAKVMTSRLGRIQQSYNVDRHAAGMPVRQPHGGRVGQHVMLTEAGKIVARVVRCQLMSIKGMTGPGLTTARRLGQP